MGFVFYDVETTGTNIQFDQILQFAAVHTDAELNEIDRFETRCRLLPHVVPSPDALRINQVTANQLTNLALPSHYEAVTRIYKRLREWSPAVFLGYNSIMFDEKFLRHAFYKNLYPAYLTSHDNNCRSDVMRAVVAATLYEPTPIIIPTDIRGKRVFKLEQIAAANGCSSGTAHDALDDTLSTLRLARVLYERAPDVWSAFMRLSKKATVIDYLVNESVVVLSEKYFDKLYSWPVTRIGENETRSANQYVFVLTCEPEKLAKLTDADLKGRLTESPKPVRVVKANAAPILMSSDQVSSNAPFQVDLNELERRADWLRNNENLCRRLIRNFEATAKQYDAGTYVEQKLYDSFISLDDEDRMEAFHKASWEKRPALVETFTDARLQELGLRLIYCEHPEVLSDDIRIDIDATMAARLVGNFKSEKVPYRTLPETIAKVERSMAGGNLQEKSFLEEHQKYLGKRLDDAKVVLGNSNQDPLRPS